MPRTCTVCKHAKVNEINEMLIRSASLRNIAEQFGTSVTALHRHRGEHLPQALVKSKDAEEVLSADNLLTRVGELEAEARRITKKAEDAGDLKTALSGIRELSRIVELMAKLTGRLDGNKPPLNDNRRVIFNFPTLSPEDLKAVENAPIIDLPVPARRLLQRPSDGQPR